MPLLNAVLRLIQGVVDIRIQIYIIIDTAGARIGDGDQDGVMVDLSSGFKSEGQANKIKVNKIKINVVAKGKQKNKRWT